MNAKEAINRISELLNLKFKEEKFFVTKLMDGETEVTNNKEAELQIGDELYIVKESTLSPAPMGEHITREGVKVTVDEAAVIVKLETKESEEVEDRVEEGIVGIEDEREDMMSSDTLADGTKIETDEAGKFAVGQQLYFMTESGEKVKAPAGEHTTQSGITIVTDGEGVITGVKYPDESGEGSLEDYKKMKEAMSEMVSLLGEFSKFAKDFESFKKDFEEFKKQPDRTPVVKNFSTNESILDWKLELLKNSKR